MTAAEIRDPTGDTGTGAEITAKETQRHSITGTALDSFVYVVEVETGTTAEEAVREGSMVQTPPPPPPTNTSRKSVSQRLMPSSRHARNKHHLIY